jgi:hypothetical protein
MCKIWPDGIYKVNLPMVNSNNKVSIKCFDNACYTRHNITIYLFEV